MVKRNDKSAYMDRDLPLYGERLRLKFGDRDLPLGETALNLLLPPPGGDRLEYLLGDRDRERLRGRS